MKNIEDLIQKAVELQSNGLVTAQIANELNVSRETVTWLLTRSKKEVAAQAPKDISVDWSSIGKSSYRLRYISQALCDMTIESINDTDSTVDIVVGISSSGIPLASLMADELGTDFAIFHTSSELGGEKKGAFSRNFGQVEGKSCVIVDDVITSGSTMMNVIEILHQAGAKPAAITVLLDKKGADTISEVPVNSLVRIVRVN